MTPNDGAKILYRLRQAMAAAWGKAATEPEIMPNGLLTRALSKLNGKPPSWLLLTSLLTLAHCSEAIKESYLEVWGEPLPEPFAIEHYEGGEA